MPLVDLSRGERVGLSWPTTTVVRSSGSTSFVSVAVTTLKIRGKKAWKWPVESTTAVSHLFGVLINPKGGVGSRCLSMCGIQRMEF